MTDARMPERYLNDRRLLRLSDGAFRAFVTATIWSVSNRTDGLIEHDDLSLIPHLLAHVHPQDLIAAGLWEMCEGGYRIVDFADTQTSKHELEVLDNIRRRDREKKKRQRALKADTVTGDVPGDASRGQHRIGQARQGQARTGQDSQGDHAGSSPFEQTEREVVRKARESWSNVTEVA